MRLGLLLKAGTGLFDAGFAPVPVTQQEASRGESGFA